jgi:hypothetical protein
MEEFDRRLLELPQFVLREITELVALPEHLVKGEQMAKKKTTTWYGIRTFAQDLRITEVEVESDTETRIYIAQKEQEKPGAYARSFFLKMSGYERWYQTREEAVSAKLARLEEAIMAKDDDIKRLKKLTAEFRKQENV